MFSNVVVSRVRAFLKSLQCDFYKMGFCNYTVKPTWCHSQLGITISDLCLDTYILLYFGGDHYSYLTLDYFGLFLFGLVVASYFQNKVLIIVNPIYRN